MPLLVFEFLGTTELLVIALVALIIFGPRKLPEIGRTIGKGMAEFKRASEDFKRSWEDEVDLEKRRITEFEPPKPAANTVARATEPELLESDEAPPADEAQRLAHATLPEPDETRELDEKATDRAM